MDRGRFFETPDPIPLVSSVEETSCTFRIAQERVPMRRISILVGGLLGLVLLGATSSWAESPNPLRLVPDQAHLVVEVTQPRQLVEGILAVDALKQLQQIQFVRELLNSTNSRRFYQFLAYFEKELGIRW